MPFTAIDTFYSRPAGSLGPKSFGLGHARRHPPSQTPPAIVRRGSSSRQFSPGSSADRFATPDPLPPTPPSRILQPPIWILYVSHPVSESSPGAATPPVGLTGMMVTVRVADFGLGPSVPPTGPSKLRLQAGKFWRFWGAETPISQKRRP